MKHLTKLIAAVVMLTLFALGLSACGSNDDSYRPASYGPQVSGHATCAWVVSSDECKNSGVDSAYWYQMPDQQPVSYHENDTSNLLSQLFLWHLMYHMWFASPSYYNHYVPTQYRSTYVTQHVTTFDHAYSKVEKTKQSKATYKTSSGKTVKGNQIKPKQLTVQNNGGSRGKNCALGSSLGPVTTFHVTPVKFGSGGGSRGGSFGGGSKGGGSKIGGDSKSGGGKSNTGGNRGQGGKSRVHC